LKQLKRGEYSYGSVAYRMRHGSGVGDIFCFVISF